MAEIYQSTLALENAYKGITHKRMQDKQTINDAVIEKNKDDADALVLELKGVIPEIDQPNINYFSFTMEQREALREILMRSALYAEIKAFRDPLNQNKPVKFSVEAPINPLEVTKRYSPATLQLNQTLGDIIPSYGKSKFYRAVENNTRLIAPTASWQYFTGREPLNFGWDQSRMKSAGVSGYRVDNLGLNWKIPISDNGLWNWYNYMGVDYSYKDYFNKSETDSPSYIGFNRYMAVKWDTVLPQPLGISGVGYLLNQLFAAMKLVKPNVPDNMMLTSMVNTSYYERENRRDNLRLGREVIRGVPTEQDPDIRSRGFTVDVIETLGGPWSAGIKYEQEWGLVTPVQDSTFGFTDEKWTFHGAMQGLNDVMRYRIGGFNTFGSYEQDSVAGSFDQEFPNPITPSAPDIFSRRASAPAGNRERIQNIEKGADIELEIYKLAVMNRWPLMVRASAVSSQYKWNEPKNTYSFGLGMGKLVNIDYSYIINNVPEVAYNSTGDQATHRIDAGVYLDIADLGKAFFPGSLGSGRSPVSGGVKLNGWLIKDEGAKPLTGFSVSFQLGFSTGATSRTKDLNRGVVGSRFYSVAENSPNNREIMEDQLLTEKDYAVKNGLVGPNGKFIYKLSDKERAERVASRKSVREKAADAFDEVLAMGLEDAQKRAGDGLNSALIELKKKAARISKLADRNSVISEIAKIEKDTLQVINDSLTSSECADAVKSALTSAGELERKIDKMLEDQAKAEAESYRSTALQTVKNEYETRKREASRIMDTARREELIGKLDKANKDVNDKINDPKTGKAEMESLSRDFASACRTLMNISTSSNNTGTVSNSSNNTTTSVTNRPSPADVKAYIDTFSADITRGAPQTVNDYMLSLPGRDKLKFRDSKTRKAILGEITDFNTRLRGGKLINGTTVPAPQTKAEAEKIYNEFQEYKTKNLTPDAIKTRWELEG